MALNARLDFEVRVEDDGPVHPVILEFCPRLTLIGSSEPLAITGALLVLPTIERRGVRLIDAAVAAYLDIGRPGRIVGFEHTWRWSGMPARFDLPTGREARVAPFRQLRVSLAGRAFLPYIPDYLGDTAPESPFESMGAMIGELAYNRGSQSGRSVFRGALFLRDSEGLEDWHQVIVRYRARRPRSWEVEPTTVEPVNTNERLPRVDWSADPLF